MQKEFKAKLNGDESRRDTSAAFTLPFDTRDVWGRAKVPVKVTINGYTWRSTIGNRGGIQYILVNADARRTACVKAGDLVTITLEPDTEKREIEIPMALQRALGKKLNQKLDAHDDFMGCNGLCGLGSAVAPRGNGSADAFRGSRRALD